MINIAFWQSIIYSTGSSTIYELSLERADGGGSKIKQRYFLYPPRVYTRAHTRVHIRTYTADVVSRVARWNYRKLVAVARFATRNCHCHKARGLHSLRIYRCVYSTHVYVRMYVRPHTRISRLCFTVMRHPVFTHTDVVGIVALQTERNHVRTMRVARDE